MVHRQPLVLALGLALVACDDRPRQWDAFVYPDSEGSDAYETIEGFRSLELCRKAAENRIRQLKEPEKADYECGYQCRFDPDWGISVCAKTGD